MLTKFRKVAVAGGLSLAATVFAVAAAGFIRAGVEAQARAGETDPVKISERALAQSFNSEAGKKSMGLLKLEKV